MKANFEKKGYNVDVKVESAKCIMTVKGIEQKAKPVKRRNSNFKWVWGYEVDGSIAKELTGKDQHVVVSHNSAEEAYESIKSAEKENEINKIKESEIKLSYNFGDWYGENAVFCNGEVLGFENVGNIFESEKLQEYLGDYPDKEVIVKKLSEYIRSLFEVNFENTEKDLDLPGAKIKYKEYDDLRGKGRYVISITFNSFEKFEEYVLKSFGETIEKKKEAEQKKKEKYEEAEKEARKTGNNVVINRFSVECNDSNEECNMDIVTVYMTPSGKTEEGRKHTW